MSADEDDEKPAKGLTIGTKPIFKEYIANKQKDNDEDE